MNRVSTSVNIATQNTSQNAMCSLAMKRYRTSNRKLSLLIMLQTLAFALAVDAISIFDYMTNARNQSLAHCVRIKTNESTIKVFLGVQ